MPSVQILPKVGEGERREWKIVGAVTDSDVGKPVKLSGAAEVTLCADGDAIYGFIDSVERGTDGGLVVVTIAEKGTVRVTASGVIALGAVVEAGANAAAGTAPTAWGVVSTHIAVAGEKNWMALEAATDGDTICVQAV